MSTINKKNIWLVLWVIFIAIFIVDPNSQSHIFFNSLHDRGADFFNVMRYIAEKDPYNNPINGVENKLYLPLSYFLLTPFSALVDYTKLSLFDCWHNSICLISFCIFTIISVAVWIYSLCELLNKHINGNYYLWMLLFTSVSLYTIERGNWILISAALVNIYLSFYDSNNRYKQKIAIICISIASVLKIFPAVFIILSIFKKDYKNFGLYIILSALLSILPFLYFKGGFDNIALMFRNVSMQTKTYSTMLSEYKYGISGLVCMGAAFIGVKPPMEVVKISGYVLLALSAIAVLKGKKEYRIPIISCIPALFQQQAFAYNAIYMLPFIYILANKQTEKYNSYFFIIYLFAFQPIQLVVHNISLSYVISNTVLLICWTFLILIALRDRGENYSSLKNAQ